MAEPRDITFTRPQVPHEPAWPSKEERLAAEKNQRPERLKKLKAEILNLFPGDALAGLRNRMEIGLEVPQAGKHHNEGVFMDSHLDNILQNIDRLAAGQIPEDLPADVQEMLRRIATPENRLLLKKYVFLHDIDKVNSLNVTYSDGRKDSPSWEEWKKVVPQEIQDDPVAMDTWMTSQGVASIGYYGHEKMGADSVRPAADALGVPAFVVTAIEKHGVAYSFSELKLETFQKHFGALSREEMEWAVTASFLDSSASLGTDGKPELTEFLNMCAAIHNHFLLIDLERKIHSGEPEVTDLDPKKMSKRLDALRKSSVRIEDSLTELVTRLASECRWSRYDSERLKAKLLHIQTVLQPPELTNEVVAGILQSFELNGRINEDQMKSWRRKLGAANQFVAAALTESEIRE